MTYQLAAKGATKDAAKEAIAAEFDKMMGVQAIHSKDRAAALANANACIDLLEDIETMGVSVNCNGYVSWNGSGINGASVSCNASHVML